MVAASKAAVRAIQHLRRTGILAASGLGGGGGGGGGGQGASLGLGARLFPEYTGPSEQPGNAEPIQVSTVRRARTHILFIATSMPIGLGPVYSVVRTENRAPKPHNESAVGSDQYLPP